MKGRKLKARSLTDGVTDAHPDAHTDVRTGNRRVRSPQKRSEQTRRQIVEAAIRCIARDGYLGATLTDISNEAGLSAGPRQYYFPSRADLMVAVWREIIDRATISVRDLNLDKSAPYECLEAIIGEEIKRTKSEEYVVDLELKLAIRGDDELNVALSPLIDDAERRTDAWWVDLFAKLPKSRSELLAARYMFTWLLRGLAIERLSRRDAVSVARMEKELRTNLRKMMLDA